MFESRHPAFGVRFAPLDAIVLVVATLLTWVLWRAVGHFALLVPVTVLHFLLFCNVFRVRRAAELLWAGVFLVNFTAWGLLASFSWWGVLGIQIPVTIVILVVEVRHPRYHGIGSRPPRDDASLDQGR